MTTTTTTSPMMINVLSIAKIQPTAMKAPTRSRVVPPARAGASGERVPRALPADGTVAWALLVTDEARLSGHYAAPIPPASAPPGARLLAA